MAQPYIGEIRMFGGNFAPAGWMFCQGQLLPISENDVLFNLIGTTYGGDGQSTFGLPDLRGHAPIHLGGGFVLGETGGVEQVTLTVQQMPAHTHPMLASTGVGNSNSPSGAVTADSSSVLIYYDGAPATGLNPAAITPSGGSQPHENVQPFLCVSFIISLFGLFPTP